MWLRDEPVRAPLPGWWRSGDSCIRPANTPPTLLLSAQHVLGRGADKRTGAEEKAERDQQPSLRNRQQGARAYWAEESENKSERTRNCEAQ